VVFCLVIFLYIDKLFDIFDSVPGVSLRPSTSLNDRILIITFISIIWYSLETRGMRHEMKKQNDTIIEQLRPYLQMVISLDGNHLSVSNIGKGDAVNIKMIFEGDRIIKSIPTSQFLGINKVHYYDMSIYSEWSKILIKVSYQDSVLLKEYNSHIFLVREKGKLIERPTILQ
jgi:hypothetical protein